MGRQRNCSLLRAPASFKRMLGRTHPRRRNAIPERSARGLERRGMVREAVLQKWAVRPNLPGRPIRDALLYAWVRAA